MSPADRPPAAGEFGLIDRLFRPLAGAPEALGLADDAALLPHADGRDLVVSKDMIVEGVHFLAGEAPDAVARRLLRVNLSDLAAKAAEPYGYFLAVAFPQAWDEAARAAFAAGLAEDQARFGLSLFGGDTVSTPGLFTASITALGTVPKGAMVRRGGARPGDMVFASGTIGDAALGLKAARGEALGLSQDDRAALEARFRLPEPRLSLRGPLRDLATAAADVSDGLLADAGHIGEASGLAVEIDLGRLPLSAPARRWLERQGDRAAALAVLAAGGDDYEVVCAAPPEAAEALARTDPALVPVGRVLPGEGVRAVLDGAPVDVTRTGYAHS